MKQIEIRTGRGCNTHRLHQLIDSFIGGEIGSTDTIKATGETGAQATLIARKQ